MKNTLLLSFFIAIFSCQKIEEKVQQTVDETTQKVKDKSSEIIQNKVDQIIDETSKSLTDSKEVKFSDVFPNNTLKSLAAVKGKSVKIPTGSNAIVFKYKFNKIVLLKFLQDQPTTNDSKSDKTAQKIDGEKIMSKLKLIEEFLPKELKDSPLFQSTKNNKSLEFYRLNRFPVQSTLIYDPKNSTFYHLVDVNNVK